MVWTYLKWCEELALTMLSYHWCQSYLPCATEDWVGLSTLHHGEQRILFHLGYPQWEVPARGWIGSWYTTKFMEFLIWWQDSSLAKLTYTIKFAGSGWVLVPALVGLQPFFPSDTHTCWWALPPFQTFVCVVHSFSRTLLPCSGFLLPFRWSDKYKPPAVNVVRLALHTQNVLSHYVN